MKRHYLLKMALIISLNLLISQAVKAEDWVCAAALCMSNPIGYSLPDCQAPIAKAFEEAAEGRFPTCGLIGSSSPTEFSPSSNEKS